MIDYPDRKKVDILGVLVDRVGSREALEKVSSFLESSGKYFVTTVYSEMVVAAHFDPHFKDILNSASLSLPDGVGVLAAADFLRLWAPRNLYLRPVWLLFGGLLAGLKIVILRFLLGELKETISGSDLIYNLAEMAQERDHQMYLLGGKNGSAKLTSARLKEKYPKLSINYSSGLINVRSYTINDNEKIINQINHFSPEILLVAYGPPYQETWIYDNLDRLNVRIALGVGGSFDMVSGRKKRAPKAVRLLSLEWLWRFLIDPLRIKRTFTAIIVFPALVFLYKLSTSDRTSLSH